MGRERRAASAELTRLTEAVAKWRAAGGGRGSRIPEELWNEAARVAQIDGTWRTAKAIAFRYDTLKKRVEDGGGGATQAPMAPVAPGTTQRVERVRPRERSRVRFARSSKKAGIVFGSTKAPATAKVNDAPKSFVALEVGPAVVGGIRTVVELEGRHGDRMRLELAGSVDVRGWVEKFWGRQR